MGAKWRTKFLGSNLSLSLSNSFAEWFWWKGHRCMKSMFIFENMDNIRSHCFGSCFHKIFNKLRGKIYCILTWVIWKYGWRHIHTREPPLNMYNIHHLILLSCDTLCLMTHNNPTRILQENEMLESSLPCSHPLHYKVRIPQFPDPCKLP
jgi:hypothetical protein